MKDGLSFDFKTSKELENENAENSENPETNTTEKLKLIAEKIRKCRKCELWRTKTNYVPGEGTPLSGIVFVGEAPGREEDIQGRPFVGNAGKLLTEMLKEKLGLRRDQVFITNILKCRPPNNRDPQPDEVEACKPYLFEQLEVLRPSVIVCLGRHSASLIFNHFGLGFPGITRVRGRSFEVSVGWGTLRLVAIYHPAAALYRPQLKEVLEKDFSKLRKFVKVSGKLNSSGFNDTGESKRGGPKSKTKNKTLADFFSGLE